MSTLTDSVSISQDSTSAISQSTAPSIPFDSRKKLTRTASVSSTINGKLYIPKRGMSSSDISIKTAAVLSGRHGSQDFGNKVLPALSETRRMNMKDIIIWQKFTRTLKQRVNDRRNEKRTFCWLDRTPSTRGSKRPGVPSVQLEPTYRTEPSRKLPEIKCKALVDDFLRTHLKTISYDSIDCAEFSTRIADDIKERVKRELLPERYKCVVYVVFGKKGGQGLQFGSLCAWNSNHDNQVSCSYQNETLFCSVTVFAVYHE